MNNYDLKCYEQTYNDPLFWQEEQASPNKKRQQTWEDCRKLTDRFYDELISRGYLVPRAKK